MIVLAIDPGSKGGIALVGDGAPLAYKMPETERDVLMLICQLAKKADRAVIEAVHSMPSDGVSSSFKFGKNVGGLRMALVAAEIPFDEVTPAKWQRGVGVGSRGSKTKTQHKNALKARAQEWFPSVKMTLAVCDALLLAEYVRRQHAASQA